MAATIPNGFTTKLAADLNLIVDDHLRWKPTPVDFDLMAIAESCNPLEFSSKCVVAPIVMSSTYLMDSANSVTVGACNVARRQDGSRVYEYGRFANPTRDTFENMIAKFDGAKHGLAFGSGTAAISAVVQLLEQGDHVVSVTAKCGGSYILYKNLARWGIETSFVLHHERVEDFISLIKPNTKMIAIESTANPTLTLVDIEKLVKSVRSLDHGDEIIITVDNTLLTPVCQRPLELGADLVIYSCSKYLGGHGDIIMGALTVNSEALYQKLRQNQIALGGVPSPFDCYLLIRSMKTLPLRMRQHYKNALLVAKYLENHPRVDKVIFAALPSHPQHELALKQQYGNCGLIGLYVKGGLKAAEVFLDTIKVFRRAASLGADVSLANLSARLTHTELETDTREHLGITENFIRLSVGLESVTSQIADLEQALAAAAKVIGNS